MFDKLDFRAVLKLYCSAACTYYTDDFVPASWVITPIVEPQTLTLRSQRSSRRKSLLAQRSKILVASHDPGLADVRRRILENAGFQVIPVTDARTVEKVCTEHKVRLIMLGYSLPPSLKRRIWSSARKKCNAPILELYYKGKPELVEQNVFAHEGHRPDDFLERVQNLLSGA